MAVPIWTNGAGTRVVAFAANWSTGVAPAVNDTALFISDYSSVNTGPNTTMAGLTTIDLDLLQTCDGFTESIGSSGNHFDISADKVIVNGTGTLWLKDGAGTTDFILVDVIGGDPTNVALQLAGTTSTILSVLRGKAVVEGSATVTGMIVGHNLNPANDARLTVNSAVTMTTLDQWGGIVACSSTVPTGRIYGGIWTQDTAVATTLHVYGGRINLNAAGTYATIHHYDGIIDCTRAGGQKIITNYYPHTARARGQLIGYKTGLVSINNEF